MSKPLVSFIIPVLNGERDIARCLQSIRGQQFPSERFEVLILDNGSTDGTLRIVRELGFEFRVITGINVGALRNRGAALAQGTYLAFVDADVELPPLWLQSALAGFANERIVASGCFPGVPENATWVQRTWDIHQRRSRHDDRPKPVAWLPSMNLMVRRRDFLAINGFNEGLIATEDVDLCYRLGQHGTILNHPGMTAIHWGEARDLRTFWRKEVWRGTDNLKGIFSHGLRWDEVPSLGYPLYMFFGVLVGSLGVLLGLSHHHTFFVPVVVIFLGLPAALLAINTAVLSRQFTTTSRLFVLYFLYGIARAFSLIKVWTTTRL